MVDATARVIADLILRSAHERKIEITNLKLQKLLYYCQAWHLAIYDAPLFPERIEAWVHGPVVPPVFGQFKEFRWKPIPYPIPATTSLNGCTDSLPVDHVNEVMDAYGHLTGTQLEALTHKEDPWRNARKGVPEDQPSNEIISHKAMIDFYRPMIERVQL
jgi:uncharacterized phage-associated protein